MLQFLLNIATMTAYKLHIYSKKDQPNYSVLIVWLELQYIRNIFVQVQKIQVTELFKIQRWFGLQIWLYVSHHENKTLAPEVLLEGCFLPFRDSDHLPLSTLRTEAVWSKSQLVFKFHCLPHCPLFFAPWFQYFTFFSSVVLSFIPARTPRFPWKQPEFYSFQGNYIIFFSLQAKQHSTEMLAVHIGNNSFGAFTVAVSKNFQIFAN